jgi:hypothetical protein
MATPTPVFPGAVATDAQLKVANNLVQTSLMVSVNTTNTVLFVASTAGFVPNCLISIDSEILAIDSVSVGPNPSLTVNPAGRGFDATTAAAHAAGAKVSMLIVAWHHNVLSAEVKAIETFLGPKGQNVATSLFYVPQAYNFAPQQPGGSLAAGNNAILLAPVPAGVNASDPNHYLYISGGTGAAEAVLISGGTAVSGAASGTVIFSCAHAHSGAWQIQSATGGLQEAIIQVGYNGGVVFVNAPIQLHASVGFLNGGSVTIMGPGFSTFLLTRASDFTSGDLIYNTGGCVVTIRDISINNGAGFVSSGAGVRNAGTVAMKLLNMQISNGQYGFVSSTGAYLDTVMIDSSDPTFQPVAGIFFQGIGAAISNVYLSNIWITSRPGANQLINGVWLQNVDGASLINIASMALYALHLECASGLYTTNIWMIQPLVDQAGQCALLIDSDGTGSIGNIQVIGGHLAGAVNGAGVQISYANISKVRIIGVDIEGNGGEGVSVASALTGNNTLILSANSIVSNNQANASLPGISIAAGTTGVTITGNRSGNDSALAGGHQVCGLVTHGAFGGTIVGNDFSGNQTDAVSIAGPMTGVMHDNKGVDDISIAVGAAATTAFPANPHFAMINAAAVTAVTCYLPPGTAGTFIGSGATFTAGASIGNSGTAAGNKLYDWYWDGTKMWINGPGF